MRTPLVSIALVSLTFLCACQGAVWGNLAVLAITIGIFMGTLTLGRGR
jgi:hypothetical protein